MPNDTPSADPTADPTAAPTADPPEPPLYASLELGDGALVVYDAENPRAWLQSNRTVSLSACA